MKISPVLLFFCSFVLLLCSSALLWAGGQKDVQDSLVKVYLSCEFPGILHESRYIPQIRVEEIAELKGAIIDSLGHIVSYVGSSWPQLNLPGIEVRLSVETQDGKKYPARLIGVDERLALVVLECLNVKGQGLDFGPTLKGTDLRFLSFVNGDCDLVSHSVVKVSGSDLFPERELQIVPTGARPKRSAVEGGLVLDGKDQLVGIVTRGRSHPFSKKIQVWKVLPSDVVRSSVRRILSEKKDIRGGWLGIMLDPGGSKLRVEKVIVGSPAEKAGLASDDVIVRVDEQSVRTRGALTQLIRWKGAGARLNLSVLRNGRLENVSTVLTERQQNGPMVSWRLEIPDVWNENQKLVQQFKIYRTVLPPYINLGMVVEPVTPQLARYFRCPKDQGLLIKSVLPQSLAQAVGLRAGDVVTKVNGQEVASYAHLEDSLRGASDGAAVIQFVRGGRLLIRKLVLQ